VLDSRPSEDANTQPVTFGLRLRRLREARGISLDRVAHVTKIHIARLHALERGDWSGWPAGVFARGFVRAYADAIGELAQPLLAEFGHLFSAIDTRRSCDAASRPRLMLVEEPRWIRAASWLGRRFNRNADSDRVIAGRTLAAESARLRIL
jgi:transcriptional regulator with XRE-family HTH domain